MNKLFKLAAITLAIVSASASSFAGCANGSCSLPRTTKVQKAKKSKKSRCSNGRCPIA